MLGSNGLVNLMLFFSYHKFTKGKDLTQYKKEELACILGKGTKDDDHNLDSLNMQEYFKIKQKSKNFLLNKQDITPSNEDLSSFSENESNTSINDKKNTDIKTSELEFNNSYAIDSEINNVESVSKFTPTKKKKRESLLSKQTVEPLNECNDVELKKKKKKEKEPIDDNVDDVDISIKKKKKSKIPTHENVDNVEQVGSECNSNDDKVTEEQKELVLTHKYQNLVDLLIENSSAGKKYCTHSPSSLFEKRMKEFADSVKNQYSTTVCSELKPANEEQKLNSIILNPDDKNFIRDFEAQKSKVLESIVKRQEMSKYVNEKSMFIAKHGDVIFFGSNLNDIKGYGDW